MTSPEAVLEALYQAEEGETLDEALATPPEGQEMQVPYKGSVVDVIRRIRGHLASAVSYGGESTLKAVRAKVVRDPASYLIPLSESSYRESYKR